MNKGTNNSRQIPRYARNDKAGSTDNSKQIPHCVRDDGSERVGIGGRSGGFAAASSSPSFYNDTSFRTERSGVRNLFAIVETLKNEKT